MLLTPHCSVHQKKISRLKTAPDTTTFEHYCVQHHGKNTVHPKHPDPNQHRARATMDCFHCGGQLFITVNPNVLDAVRIHIVHKQPHTHYVDIGSEKVEGLIAEM